MHGLLLSRISFVSSMLVIRVAVALLCLCFTIILIVRLLCIIYLYDFRFYMNNRVIPISLELSMNSLVYFMNCSSFVFTHLLDIHYELLMNL